MKKAVDVKDVQQAFDTGAASLKLVGLPPQAQPVYNGEELTTQAGVNTAQVTQQGDPAILPGAGSEAFDEPLTKAQVIAIANSLHRITY